MASIKREHQEGCAGDRCSCPWRLDYRPLGMAGPRRRLLFATKKLADNHLSATRVRVSRGEYVDPAKVPTFAKAAAEWIAGKGGRHPSTLAAWRVHLGHLRPLDGFRLDRIDVAMVERVRDEMLKPKRKDTSFVDDASDKRQRSLGPKTVSAIMTTAAAVFKMAIRKGYATSNPAAIAERPRRAVIELTTEDAEGDGDKGLRAVRPDEVFSAEEIARLLAHADSGLFRILFATVAATGLRPEEVYALRWTDLQLEEERPQLLVRRSPSWSRGEKEADRVRPKFYEPKTRAGYRSLPLPAAAGSLHRPPRRNGQRSSSLQTETSRSPRRCFRSRKNDCSSPVRPRGAGSDGATRRPAVWR
jgi:integrase